MLPDSGTTKLLRLWRLCWTSGRDHIQVSCRVLAARIRKFHFFRQYRLLMNGPVKGTEEPTYGKPFSLGYQALRGET